MCKKKYRFIYIQKNNITNFQLRLLISRFSAAFAIYIEGLKVYYDVCFKRYQWYLIIIIQWWWWRVISNSIAPDGCSCNLKVVHVHVIFKLRSMIDILSIWCEMETKASLMICQHWFRQWLGANRQQAITWTNVDPDLSMASLGHNELKGYLLTRGMAIYIAITWVLLSFACFTHLHYKQAHPQFTRPDTQTLITLLCRNILFIAPLFWRTDYRNGELSCRNRQP